MVEETKASITTRKVRVPLSEVFIPGVTKEPPTVPVEPTPPTEPTVPRRKVTITAILEPEEITEFKAFPDFIVSKKSLVLDIETTGTTVTKSRLMSIGFLDPSEETPIPNVFIDENEEKVLQQFIDFYESGGYTEIIGFNLPFDFRFLFVKLMRYRMQAPNFLASRIYDLQDVFNKVRPGQVFGRNKSEKMDAWVGHLFGLEKTLTIKELFSAWKKKEFDKIIEYNGNDVVLTYALWLADQHVKGNISVELPATATTGTTIEQESAATVQVKGKDVGKRQVFCSACVNQQEMVGVEAKFRCKVCGNPNFNLSP